MTDPIVHLTNWRRMGAQDPSVVMVHGSAQGSSAGGDKHFAAQSRLALRGWNVIVPDRPGHGRSPSPGRGDDAEADGRWVAELLGDGAHLVGHSFGGAVALAAAVAWPSAVRSLTLIEPAMQALGMDDPRVQPFLMSIMQLFTGSQSAADLAAGFIKLVNIPPEIGGTRSPEEMEAVGLGLRAMKLTPPDALRAGLAAVKAAKIPLLVVSGGWSPAFEAVSDRAAELGGGRREVIASEHHLPQLIGDGFNDLLNGFMRAAG